MRVESNYLIKPLEETETWEVVAVHDRGVGNNGSNFANQIRKNGSQSEKKKGGNKRGFVGLQLQ